MTRDPRRYDVEDPYVHGGSADVGGAHVGRTAAAVDVAHLDAYMDEVDAQMRAFEAWMQSPAAPARPLYRQAWGQFYAAPAFVMLSAKRPMGWRAFYAAERDSWWDRTTRTGELYATTLSFEERLGDFHRAAVEVYRTPPPGPAPVPGLQSQPAEARTWSDDVVDVLRWSAGLLMLGALTYGWARMSRVVPPASNRESPRARPKARWA